MFLYLCVQKIPLFPYTYVYCNNLSKTFVKANLMCCNMLWEHLGHIKGPLEIWGKYGGWLCAGTIIGILGALLNIAHLFIIYYYYYYQLIFRFTRCFVEYYSLFPYLLFYCSYQFIFSCARCIVEFCSLFSIFFLLLFFGFLFCLGKGFTRI